MIYDEFNFTSNQGDKTLNKLILLFVIDRMEVPITESIILDICSTTNEWIPYMDCKPIIPELLDNSFIYASYNGDAEPLYTISAEGRGCLAHFFSMIPQSLRDTISVFIKVNRMNFKRKQEYESDSVKNADGTFNVILKINDIQKPLMKLEVTVSDKEAAKSICKSWKEKAPNVYSAVLEVLTD